jgi:GNAT superfamily N-acetyltransferase
MAKNRPLQSPNFHSVRVIANLLQLRRALHGPPESAPGQQITQRTPTPLIGQSDRAKAVRKLPLDPGRFGATSSSLGLVSQPISMEGFAAIARASVAAARNPSYIPEAPGIARIAPNLVRRPLDKANVASAVALAESVFGTEAGAGPELRKAARGSPYREIESGKQILGARSWVVEEESSGKLLGTVGLYRTAEDGTNALWVNWFCVDPDTRGQGLGKKLMNFAIEQAKRSGRKYLRLYTEDLPFEAAAQPLYERSGLRVVKKVPIEGTPYNRIYRELDLRPNG